VNLKEIDAAVRNGGNSHCTVHEIPGLNHFLQTAKTGLPDAVAAIDETLSPVALKIIGVWIEDQIR